MSQKPTTGASILVYQNNKVLLIKRGKEPHKGCWSLPGGGHEYGETLEDCALRELKEETGISAKKLKFRVMRDRFTYDDDGKLIYHYVLVTYQAFEIAGTPQAMDDAMDIGWFDYEQMLKLKTTPHTLELLKDLLGDEFIKSL